MPLIAEETRAKQAEAGRQAVSEGGKAGGRGRPKNSPSPQKRRRAKDDSGKATTQAAKAAHTTRDSVEKSLWLQRVVPDLAEEWGRSGPSSGSGERVALDGRRCPPYILGPCSSSSSPPATPSKKSSPAVDSSPMPCRTRRPKP